MFFPSFRSVPQFDPDSQVLIYVWPLVKKSDYDSVPNLNKRVFIGRLRYHFFKAKLLDSKRPAIFE